MPELVLIPPDQKLKMDLNAMPYPDLRRMPSHVCLDDFYAQVEDDLERLDERVLTGDSMRVGCAQHLRIRLVRCCTNAGPRGAGV